jgi:hypothetical protein
VGAQLHPPRRPSGEEFLPESLLLRRQRERIDDVAAPLRTEQAVRDHVEELNRQIRRPVWCLPDRRSSFVRPSPTMWSLDGEPDSRARPLSRVLRPPLTSVIGSSGTTGGRAERRRCDQNAEWRDVEKGLGNRTRATAPRRDLTAVADVEKPAAMALSSRDVEWIATRGLWW